MKRVGHSTPTGNWPGYVQKTSGTTDLDQSRTHNKVNEITAITATTGTDWADPAHDRAGNMTTLPKPSSPADPLTCQYDTWHRLVKVTDGEIVVGKYDYDGLDRRIKKHLDSQSPDAPNGIDTYVHYFYNRVWQVLETRDTDSKTAAAEALPPKYQYVWSSRYIDAAILRDQNSDEGNLCDDDRLYYLGDANFSVTCLLDRAGDAVERYVYAPFGHVTICAGSSWSIRNTSSYSNGCLFTGRRLDEEAGFHHFRVRYYDPSQGRFLARDAFGYSDGQNQYGAYFIPNGVDPTGMWRQVAPHNPDLWEAEERDTFEGLLTHLQSVSDWTVDPRSYPARLAACIRPRPEFRVGIAASNVELMARRWNEKRPAPCAVYDVGNVTDNWEEGDAVLASVGRDDNGYIAAAQEFYGIPGGPQGNRHLSGLALAGKIKDASQHGRRPIRLLTIIGHSWHNTLAIGGSRAGSIAGQVTFKLGDLLRASRYSRLDSWPPYERAVKGEFPAICWFRGDAEVRLSGCITWSFAVAVAQNLLRPFAAVHGTLLPTWAAWPGVMGFVGLPGSVATVELFHRLPGWQKVSGWEAQEGVVP